MYPSPSPHVRPTRLVIGLGGCGSKVVARIAAGGLLRAQFVLCDTDSQNLARYPNLPGLYIGARRLQGHGSVGDPLLARQAVQDNVQQFKSLLSSQPFDTVFIVGGIGGSTTAGVAPVLAELSRKCGMLTIALMMTPFGYEGQWRQHICAKGLQEMRRTVDSLAVFDGEQLQRQHQGLSRTEQQALADHNMYTTLKEIAYTLPGIETQIEEFLTPLS